MEIDPHAEIEVLLGFAADHRGEVEDHAGVGVEQSLGGTGLAEVADSELDAGVVGQRRGAGADVADHDSLNLVLGPITAAHRSALEQRRHESTAKKTRSSGHQDFHVQSSRAWGTSAPVAVANRVAGRLHVSRSPATMRRESLAIATPARSSSGAI